jgi:hypothetical protein
VVNLRATCPIGSPLSRVRDRFYRRVVDLVAAAVSADSHTRRRRSGRRGWSYRRAGNKNAAILVVIPNSYEGSLRSDRSSFDWEISRRAQNNKAIPR